MTEALCVDATCSAVCFTSTGKLHERLYAPHTLATLTLGSAVMAAIVVLPAELLGTRHGVVVRGAGVAAAVAAAVAAVAILAWLSIRSAIRPAHPGWAKARRR
jgi:hypothetical protein